MKANIILIRKHKSYSEEFKRSIVKDFESGQFSVIQLSKLHSICFQTIYHWIYKYSHHNEQGTRIVEMKESSSKKLKDQENGIKELERMLGQKQIKIEYLEKMIELAKEEFDIDLKKNSNTSQLDGSKPFS